MQYIAEPTLPLKGHTIGVLSPESTVFGDRRLSSAIDLAMVLGSSSVIVGKRGGDGWQFGVDVPGTVLVLDVSMLNDADMLFFRSRGTNIMALDKMMDMLQPVVDSSIRLYIVGRLEDYGSIINPLKQCPELIIIDGRRGRRKIYPPLDDVRDFLINNDRPNTILMATRTEKEADAVKITDTYAQRNVAILSSFADVQQMLSRRAKVVKVFVAMQHSLGQLNASGGPYVGIIPSYVSEVLLQSAREMGTPIMPTITFDPPCSIYITEVNGQIQVLNSTQLALGFQL